MTEKHGIEIGWYGKYRSGSYAVRNETHYRLFRYVARKPCMTHLVDGMRTATEALNELELSCRVAVIFALRKQSTAVAGDAFSNP